MFKGLVCGAGIIDVEDHICEASQGLAVLLYADQADNPVVCFFNQSVVIGISV